MTVQAQKRRFTVDEYHRIARAGVLGEDDRVELLEGAIVEMGPIGSRHAACVDRLNRLLSRLVGDGFLVRVQSPLRLGPYSEPAPDITVLRFRDDFYADAHPGPEDALLVVEVADTSLEIDRGIKCPLYAAAGVPEVWIVDLAGRYVEVRRQPGKGEYIQQFRVSSGEPLIAEGLPDLVLGAGDVLG
jgi:Uma2 family endonuclease